MKLLYTNAQSIIKKMAELRAIIAMKKPDVVALTETWTNCEIDNSFLHIDNYELTERQDRVDTRGGRGGGILIYVKKGICSWKVKVEGPFCQCAGVKLKGRGRDIGIFVIYRSPNSTRENDEALCDLMRQMNGNYILVGDFNFPGIKWEMGGSDAKGRAFYDTIEDMHMTQHVEEPTHISGNLLDLVISSDENMVRDVRMEGRLAASDHELIEVEFLLDVKQNHGIEYVRDYARGDFIEMRRCMMNIQWAQELENLGVEESWRFIKGKLTKLVEALVPMKKKRSAGAPPWLDRDVKKAIREKKKAWNIWKKSGNLEEKREYRMWETKTKKLIRNRKNALERQVAKDSKLNPKRFFSFINSARRSRSSIGPLNSNGFRVVDPKDQAELLNNHYSSVFTRCDVPLPTKEYSGTTKLSDIEVNKVKIKDAIDHLREFSAPGPDNVTNKIIVELKNEISFPLAILFRKSLDESCIPDEWRLSNVTPVYKKGSKAEPGNYRPVSLTSNTCKLMERVINETLGEYLGQNVLKNTQHGFRRGRSCQTNLIEFFDKVGGWLDESQNVDVLYLDFSRAFDKVDHERMMVKLAAAGIEGKLWAWIKDWLSKRYQRVVVDGEASGWLPVVSGMPQGTVLAGPLFTVYVNDIDELIEALIRLFADDTKMARVIRNLLDSEQFQADINRLAEWARKWAMEFNLAKCKVMHLGRSNPKTVYTMNGVALSETDEEKDLGVWVNSALKPSTQCEVAAKSANQMLGLIAKSFHYRTKSTLIPLYKTLVRPKLEFSAAAWSPWLEKDVDCLEKVQRRLVRLLSNVKGSTYEAKLNDAGLTTLRERRERGDLIEAFKTLNGFNHVNRSDWFEIAVPDQTRHGTRSTSTIASDGVEDRTTIQRERARTESRNQLYRFRTARAWNLLPDAVRNAKSTNAFKNAYDAWKKKTQTQ